MNLLDAEFPDALSVVTPVVEVVEVEVVVVEVVVVIKDESNVPVSAILLTPLTSTTQI